MGAAEQILSAKHDEIVVLCRKYTVSRLRLFGSSLGVSWNNDSSDFDFLAEFGSPIGMNSFDQLFGFIVDMETLLERKVDVVDWNAAKNPFFRKHAETQAQEIYAA